MNGLIIFTLVACAAAEPQLMLNPWGWGNAGILPSTYSGLPVTTPMVYSGMNLWSHPLLKGYEMPKPETDYAMKGKYVAEAAGGVIHKAKREADPLWGYSAMPYAYNTLPMTYGMPLAYSKPIAYSTLPIMPVMPKTKIIADDTMKPDTPDYAMKGQYIAESAGVIHKAKREADPLWGYSAMPYAYNTLPMTYGMPLAYSKPIAYNTLPFMPIMPKMIADDTLKAGTPDYAMKGQYIAESAGIIHKAKRQAPEEDKKAEDNKIILTSGIPTFYNRLPFYGTSLPAINAWPYATATPFNTLPMVRSPYFL